MDSVGTLKVDQILPAAAVADTVLGSDVFIPKSDNLKAKANTEASSSDKGFLLSKNEDGLQTVSICSEESLESTFGAGDSPLETDVLDSGSLSSISPETQKRFSQAIILAMHGLTVQSQKRSRNRF